MKPGLCPDMPFFPNDWLSSTSIASMSPAQEGAYIRLLAHGWNDPHCTLPDDGVELASLSRLGSDWEKLGAKVKACFVPDPERPGRIYNVKQRDVRMKQDARMQSAKLHGKKAAEARWGKSQAMPEHHAGTARAMPEHNPGNTSYSAPLLGSHSDKAYSIKAIKLSPRQKEIADRIEAALGVQWNKKNAGKWINRIKGTPTVKPEPDVVMDVANDTLNATAEGRIKIGEAQHAECYWKILHGQK